MYEKDLLRRLVHLFYDRTEEDWSLEGVCPEELKDPFDITMDLRDLLDEASEYLGGDDNEET